MLTVQKPKRILRPKEAWERLGIGRQTFYQRFVATGRLRLFPIGTRAKGVLESDVEQLIDELASK